VSGEGKDGERLDGLQKWLQAEAEGKGIIATYYSSCFTALDLQWLIPLYSDSELNFLNP